MTIKFPPARAQDSSHSYLRCDVHVIFTQSNVCFRFSKVVDKTFSNDLNANVWFSLVCVGVTLVTANWIISLQRATREIEVLSRTQRQSIRKGWSLRMYIFVKIHLSPNYAGLQDAVYSPTTSNKFYWIKALWAKKSISANVVSLVSMFHYMWRRMFTHVLRYIVHNFATRVL